ncbi:MAG: fibronectin type III domain-containing protein [Candidatus Levybacteria bacterium]|nr:fibronectin type III domain-containing protein [Candidatus Levybacteria bacterium]MDZ4228430.1 fibronectin type III domain-containing protein [Candidatus Levybacteria bacterium]
MQNISAAIFNRVFYILFAIFWVILFTVFSPKNASASLVPTDSQVWPTKVDLSVGESYVFNLQDGTSRTLKLLSYQPNSTMPRNKVNAAIQVSGAEKTESHTLEVGFGADAVSINGVRIYAYTWKEANAFGFEDVGRQGGFPLTSGKDVGFAVSDAMYTMYPAMNDYTYPTDIAFNQGSYLQTFLDPDGWAHSGYDMGGFGNKLLAITDGYVWTQGHVKWITKTAQDKWDQSKPCWVFTHTGSALVSDGQYVTKGTPIAEFPDYSTSNDHTHMGSCNSFDFGSWYFSTQIWNYEHKNDFPAPRYWLINGPFDGDINSNTMSLPSVPAKGDTFNGKEWKFSDNLVNSITRMGELVSDAPFSGHATREPINSVGYAATYVYSPFSTTATLKFGSSYGAKVWLNDSPVHEAIETRYNTFDTLKSTPIEIDKYSLPINLKAGWNTLIIKTNQGSRQNTSWLFSSKIGDANGNKNPDLIFSTRDIKLKLTGTTDNSISVSWSHPDYHGTFISSYKVDVATDIGFKNIVKTDSLSRSSTSHTITELNLETEYFVRVRPYNDYEMAGATYWQHYDFLNAVTGKTGGVALTPTPTTTPTPTPAPVSTSTLPSQNPPASLKTNNVPQFVLLGSDDNNRAGGVEFFVNTMKNRLNPVGSGNSATYDNKPALMSFYLIGTNIYGPNINSQEWRDQYMAAYNNGHELGNHGFYGLANDAPRGTVNNWINNWIKPTHDAMVKMGVSAQDILGMRAAQDEVDPAFYQALKQFGYEYGNSSTTNHSTNLPAWWTGTLDNGWPGGATWDTRNYGQTQGVWEIPQTYAKDQSAYCDKDWFDTGKTGAQMVADLKETFTSLYNGTRTPYSICLHSQEWGPINTIAGGGVPTASILEKQQAMKDFMDWLLNGQFPDVRIITHSQLLDWMKNPVALGPSPDPVPTPSLVATPTPTPTSVTLTNTTMNVYANSPIYAFKDTVRGVATNTWNWLYEALWDRPGYQCCPPGKRDAIIEATKLLKPGVIRFAGGLWANRTGWDRGDIAPDNGAWTYKDPSTGTTYNYTHAYKPPMVDAAADFAKQVGAQMLVQVNVCDNNPKMWADLVKYANIEKKYAFKYWEIGNEIDLDKCTSADEYMNRYASYSTALKAVDPSIKIIGPVPTMPDQKIWFDKLRAKMGTGLDGLVWHWYPLTEWTTDKSTFAYQGGSVEALLNYNESVGSCQEGFGCPGDSIPKNRLDRTRYRRSIPESMKQEIIDPYRLTDPTLEMAITEFGPHAVMHESPINSNHLAAVWLADVLARHAYNGVDIITYYSLEDGGAGLGNSRGLLGTNGDTSLDVRPIYGAMYLYAQHFGDKLVKTSTSDSKQKVVVWGSTDSTDPGKLKLMAVNLDSSSKTTTIQLNDFIAASGKAYELTSGNPTSLANPDSFTNHTTKINGVQIPDVQISNPTAFTNTLTSIPGKNITTITSSGSNSAFTYAIPAYSAVAIILDKTAGGVAVPISNPTPTTAPKLTPTPAPILIPTSTPIPTTAPSPTPTATPLPIATPTPVQYSTTITTDSSSTTVRSQISISSDDAYHVPAGWPGFASKDVVVFAGAPGSNGPVWGGWRWSGLNIPKNAKILDAYVELNQSGWGYVIPTILSFENSSNPATFSSASSPYSRWQKHTAFTLNWTWKKSVPGSWIKTPPLVNGIQELVNRFGAINSIVLLESGEKVIQARYHSWSSFDNNPKNSARLIIKYQTP